ncbi:hypothetical protein ACFL47_02625 [Candidatus Latescibacterota bacterium]
MPDIKNTTLDDLISGPFGKPIFVVKYGSDRNDIDLLAVYKDTPLRNEIITGRIDLLNYDINCMNYLIRNFDPVITEPLLTGQLIMGNEDDYKYYLHKCDNQLIKTEMISYLYHRAISAYDSAYEFLNSFNDTQQISPSAQFGFWNNLLWAISYREYARYYSKSIQLRTSAVQLQHIVSQLPSDILKLWNFSNKSKRSCKKTKNFKSALYKYTSLCL